MPDIEILSELSRNDYRVVSEAYDFSMRRDVTVIAVTEELESDDNIKNALFEEARYLVSIRHPGFLRIISLNESKGQVIADKFKGDLHQINQQGPLNADQVRSLLNQTLDALHALHTDYKSLHSQISPEKLLFDERRVSFGLFHGQPLEDLRAVRPHEYSKYLPPEMISESFGRIGPELDLYSLGIIALESLLGPKFDSLFPIVLDNPKLANTGWLRWHTSDTPFKPVKEYVPGVPTDLATVIDSMLSKNVANRPRSAKEALDRLSHQPLYSLISGRVVVDEKPTPQSESDIPSDKTSSDRAADVPALPIEEKRKPDPPTNHRKEPPPDQRTISSKEASKKTSSHNRNPQRRWIPILALLLMLGLGGLLWAYQNDMISQWMGNQTVTQVESAIPPDPQPDPKIVINGTIDPPDASLKINDVPVNVVNGKWEWSSLVADPVKIEADKPSYFSRVDTVTKTGRFDHHVRLEAKPLIEIAGTLTPPNAMVKVDGETVTSKDKDGVWKWNSMTAKSVLVTASLEGYEDWEKVVYTQGVHDLRVELLPLPEVTLTGTLKPANATLRINDVAIEVNEGKWKWSSAKMQEIKLQSSLSGYDPWERNIVDPGAHKINIALSKTPAVRVSGSIDPKDATLIINKKPILAANGKWTWESEETVPFEISLSKNGYKRISKTIPSAELKGFNNNARAIDLKLEPILYFTVNGVTDPPDAKMTINNAEVRIRNGAWEYRFEEGTKLDVNASHPNYETKSITLQPTASTKVELNLDPIFTIEPRDAQLTVDGLLIANRPPKLAIPLSDQPSTITLTKGGQSKEFKLTRSDIKALNFKLTLPMKVDPKPLATRFDRKAAHEAQLSYAASLNLSAERPHEVGFKMIIIPPGDYTFGAENEDLSPANKLPARKATIQKPFYMSESEITQAQWLKVMGTKPWHTKGIPEGDDYPAVYITWKDAERFCQELNKRKRPPEESDWEYRLPTEIEWEWSCRAGTQSEFSCEPDKLTEYANFEENTGNAISLRPVAQLLSNNFGLYDTHGNVTEWCADIFDSESQQFVRPSSTAIRRGGCWNRNRKFISSSARDAFRVDNAVSSAGLRVVMAGIK
ncbi:SUMF1/EgtB/PvdO family nonheme iron enzyme [Planctomicrobium sp. SH668]|uniref:SUMF1/EgtB/PvdO family nonheme iron enzyme n=1 Tax=Planctomicrobium sp. SH668 TaxID=3448126 RepID=UPI003F5C4DAE